MAASRLFFAVGPALLLCGCAKTDASVRSDGGLGLDTDGAALTDARSAVEPAAGGGGASGGRGAAGGGGGSGGTGAAGPVGGGGAGGSAGGRGASGGAGGGGTGGGGASGGAGGAMSGVDGGNGDASPPNGVDGGGLDASVPPEAGAADGSADGPLAVTLPFSVIESLQDHRLELAAGAYLVSSALDYQSLLGRAPPVAVDFASQQVVVVSAGPSPFPSTVVELDQLELGASGSSLLAVSTVVEPGATCNVFELEATALVAVAIDALATAPTTLAMSPTTETVDCDAAGASVGASCGQSQLCASTAICGGLTRGDAGLCYPTSNYGVFASDVAEAVPDAGVLARTIDVSGLATVDVDVIVRVVLDHAAAEQLRITLTNPSGNEVVVVEAGTLSGSVPAIERVPVGFSGDESVNGAWQLKVEDTASGITGQLLGVELEIVSRLD